MPSAIHLVPHRYRPRGRPSRHQVGAGVATTATNLWSSSAVQSGMSDARSFASQLSLSFSPPLSIQAADYVFNTDVFAGIGVDPLAVANIADLVANGQYGDAAVASIELTMSTVGGPVGMAMSAIVGAAMILGDDQGSPCTVPGCGNMFNMQECPQGNPFTWAAIANTLPAVPPLQPFHFSGNPNVGPTNLLDWGSYDWATGQNTLMYPGGPGSFEEAFEQALMSAWDTAAQPPLVCQTIQAIISPAPGTPPGPFGPVNQSDGSIMGPNPASAATRAAVLVSLCMTAGALLAGFVTGWNKANPGPQRKITYTVPQPGSIPGANPLAPGFWGLAWAAGIAPGKTISIVVNDPRGASSLGPSCWPVSAACNPLSGKTPPPINNIPAGASLISSGFTTPQAVIPNTPMPTLPVEGMIALAHVPMGGARPVPVPTPAPSYLGLGSVLGAATALAFGWPWVAAGVLVVGGVAGFVEALEEL